MVSSGARCPVFDYPPLRVNPFDLPVELAGRRDRCPVGPVRLWDGSRAWLVTGHAEARAVLTDRRFSSDPRRPGFPMVAPSFAAFQADRELGFSQLDDPEHARLRRMIAQEFSASRIAALRPAITEVVERRLDGMISKPVDLVTEFAAPVSLGTIARLIGVPYADHEFFQSMTTVRFARGSSADELESANARLHDYIGRLLDTKTTGDDLLSRLAAGQVALGRLTRAQAVAMGALLILTGHRTTTNMIALSVLTTLTQGLAQRLRDAPALVGPAVEEFLRFHTIGDAGLPRLATEDAVIGDVHVRAGEAVIVSVVAANRDPRRFGDPDRIDIDRDARRHLGFGAGVHHCIGHGLARAEIEIALAAVLRRLPTLRPATKLESVAVQNEMSLHGVSSLPVTW